MKSTIAVFHFELTAIVILGDTRSWRSTGGDRSSRVTFSLSHLLEVCTDCDLRSIRTFCQASTRAWSDTCISLINFSRNTAFVSPVSPSNFEALCLPNLGSDMMLGVCSDLLPQYSSNAKARDEIGPEYVSVVRLSSWPSSGSSSGHFGGLLISTRPAHIPST